MVRRIDPSLIPSRPHLDFEGSLWEQGISLVAGIDEAGRGALAGPVTAAAVILPQQQSILSQLSEVQDSKMLTPSERESLRLLIEKKSITWGVGFASNKKIDQISIIGATRLAIERALEELSPKPDYLLVDYLVLPELNIPQTRLVKGDARSLSIAAASILAKTHRDEWMNSAAEEYPTYDFISNKGYGTNHHRRAIEDIGPCPLHRKSFSPIKDLS